ncbi:MAG: hypothetical protein EXS13_02445 [Planctomycetes bacterium]|nr:hypothetical protein [Planctomycetota bacterium]
MKTLPFALAVTALLGAGANFFAGTRPLLMQIRALRTTLNHDLHDASKQAQRIGGPPSNADLERARSAVRNSELSASSLAEAWFRGARSASDYLVPRNSRPRPIDEDARHALESTLLELPMQFKELPGLTATRLGLVTPTLSKGLATDDGELGNQIERAVIAQFLATALAHHLPLEVDGVVIDRNRGGATQVRLGLVGSLDVLAGALDTLGRPDNAAPPRQIERFALRRQESADWRALGSRFPSPPLRLEVELRFCFPPTAPEAP